MKKFSIPLVMILALLFLTVSCSPKSPEPSKTYKVGDTGPAGGLIFHVAATGGTTTYYEAAPLSGETKNVYLGNFYDNGVCCSNLIADPSAPGFEESTLNAIGRGKANTEAIMNVAKKSTVKIYSDQNPVPEKLITEHAAKVAAECTVGGKSDWYLPSLDELQAMYTELKAKSLGDFSDIEYWSSSQRDMNSPAINFADGQQGGGKSYEYQFAVRPIRSFQ